MKKLMLFVILCIIPVCGSLHKNSRTTQVHSPFRWVFADSAARVAESVTTSDTDKVAYQIADSSIWVLRDNDPKTWIELNNNFGDLFVDSVVFDGSESKFVHFDSTFACTLYFDSTGGTKFRDSCMATATIIGKNCILTIPKDLHSEATGASVSVGFHFSIPSKFLSTTAYQVPVRSDTNSVATWGRFNTSNGHLGLFVSTGTTIFPPTAGGPYPFTITYRLD